METTHKFKFPGGGDRPDYPNNPNIDNHNDDDDDDDSMNGMSIMMYGHCAFWSRQFYGTTYFLETLSTYLIGYRQISLAHTIRTIVMSGNLVSNNLKDRSERMFRIFVICLVIYFCIFLATNIIMVIVMPDGDNLFHVITTFDVVDALFILAGLLLYYCSIRMLRSSIAKCTSF